jgi:bis(5'-nucleosyl)-tetraphosphatase (symmetrical)
VWSLERGGRSRGVASGRGDHDKLAVVQPVFIGDVQGCAAELAELLERVQGVHGEDLELWLVGDLINRGPASLQVLQAIRPLVKEGRARYVLGNHEIWLLESFFGQRTPRYPDTTADLLACPDIDDWIEWIRGRPLVETGELSGRPFAMVHAAVHPDWDLHTLVKCAHEAEARLGHPDRSVAEHFLAGDRERDVVLDALSLITSCRSVGPDGSWSSEEPVAPGVPWHTAWSRRAHSYGVVYGHWALQGLHVAPGLRGLDTGCVHHGRGRDGFLTAWLPKLTGDDPFALPDREFWQVRAHRRYYREPSSEREKSTVR